MLFDTLLLLNRFYATNIIPEDLSTKKSSANPPELQTPQQSFSRSLSRYLQPQYPFTNIIVVPPLNVSKASQTASMH